MSVFHAYDIRGLAPEELNEDFARRLAVAVERLFAPKMVILGRDMRLTSEGLHAAFADELSSRGVEIIDIGLCTTPMFNVLVGLSNGAVDLGVIVTASHNPGEYNGFKMVRGDMTPVGQGSGMEELEMKMKNEEWRMRNEEGGNKSRGKITGDAEGTARYVDRILSIADLPSEMPEILVAVDGGNGMEGIVLPEIRKRLPWLKINGLYLEPDGSFPNHEANPLKRETLKDLQAAVKNGKCALGVAYDGDADRVGLVDENGEIVPGDLVTAIIAQELLQNHPGEKILYDVRSSWSVPEAIAAAGGEGKMCRVGHAYIKRQMREEKALFAGEISMHYYFRDLFNVESGDLLLMLILRRLAKEKKTLSALWKPLAAYAHSGEINYSVSDKQAVMQAVRQAFESGVSSVLELDGLRMEFRHADRPQDDWWFSLRESNTEPLLRLNVESHSHEMTELKVKALTEKINLT